MKGSVHDMERARLRALYADLATLTALDYRVEPLRNNVTNTGASGELIMFGVFSHLDPLGLEALAIKSAYAAPLGGDAGLCWNTYENMPAHLYYTAIIRIHVRPAAVTCTVPPELLAAWDQLMDQCITQYSDALRAHGTFPPLDSVCRCFNIRVAAHTMARADAAFLVIGTFETQDGRLFIGVFTQQQPCRVVLFLPVRKQVDGTLVPLQFGPPGNIPLDVMPRYGPYMHLIKHTRIQQQAYCWGATEIERVMRPPYCWPPEACVTFAGHIRRLDRGPDEIKG